MKGKESTGTQASRQVAQPEEFGTTLQLDSFRVERGGNQRHMMVGV